jgi:hypothetical protein
MTVSIEFLAIAIGLVVTIATFLYSRFKEAEARGRLLQRIDTLEQNVSDMRSHHRATDDKIGLHDNDITKLTGDIESLRDLMERMDKKLDRVLERDCT